MSLIDAAKQLQRMEAGTYISSRFPTSVDQLNRIIGYKPRDIQNEISAKEKRFNSEVLHRRAGKTVMKTHKLFTRAAWCPFEDGRYAYTAPTYQMAKDIAWMYLMNYHTRLLEYLGEDPDRWRNASEMHLTIPTASGGKARIRLYGVDNPKQRLRGLYLDGVVNDEWALSPPSVWTEQIRPMLSDQSRSGLDIWGNKNQWADFIFTPAGRNLAYQMHMKATAWSEGRPVIEVDPDTHAETEIMRDDWYACVYKASETGLIDPKELQDALSDMGRSRYEQEYECSFDAAVEGAIFAKEIAQLRERGEIGDCRWINLLPVNTAWDLGWDDATAIWFFQTLPGGGINVIDYWEGAGASYDFIASMLAEKPYRYGYNLLPHDVEVHEQATGKSRASILRSLGVRVTTVPKVDRKADSIAAAQALLPRCRFDEIRCAAGIDALALYRRKYDEKLQRFSEKELHDWASHAADAFQGLAMGVRRARGANSDPNNQIVAEM